MCRAREHRASLPVAVLLWLAAAGAAGGDVLGGGGAGASRLECPEVRRSPPAAAPGPSLLAHSWPPEVKQALGASRGLWAALDQPGVPKLLVRETGRVELAVGN